MGELIDLTGKSFGRFVVLHKAPNRFPRTSARWICKCVCGATKDVWGQHLRNGKTQSCGCLRKENAGKMRKPMPGTAFNNVIGQYKKDARIKEVEFRLSKEEMLKIVGLPCVYCGAEPSNMSTTSTGATFKYNGVDRIDSNKGYVLENCSPCCRLCNWMKKDLSVSDFITHIKRIINHNERNA